MNEPSKVGYVFHVVLTVCFIVVVFSRNDSLKFDMITVALVELRESERCSNKCILFDAIAICSLQMNIS